jgi:conjugative transfer signal peptidase TraF
VVLSDGGKEERASSRRGRLLVAGVIAVAGLAFHSPGHRLVWNRSKSAPLGLYRVWQNERGSVDQWVIASLPGSISTLAARRRYIAAGVPVLKQIVAATGDRVCALGRTISVNGRPVAVRKLVDRNGRGLPQWRGCRHLDANHVFLLNRLAPDSFDSRYFGPISRQHLLGVVELLRWSGRS